MKTTYEKPTVTSLTEEELTESVEVLGFSGTAP